MLVLTTRASSLSSGGVLRFRMNAARHSLGRTAIAHQIRGKCDLSACLRMDAVRWLASTAEPCN